jgi:hypothetical protein
MLITISACQKDAHLLIDLLKWIELLGRCDNHIALLVFDSATPFDDVLAAREIAERISKGVEVVTNDVSVLGWVEGPKSLFLNAAQWAQNNKMDFLVMETDSVPIATGWCDVIESEYKKCGRKFMGHVYASGNPSLPPMVMSGIGVYAHDSYTLLHQMIREGANWDMAMTPGVINEAHDTQLIRHLWGEMNNPPVFGDENIPGTAQFCLKQIPSECVLWHRSKDHSLIRSLRRRDYPHTITTKPITVVFPVAQDIGLAILHAQWMHQMGFKSTHKAIISFDATVDVIKLKEFENLITPLFSNVELFTYPTPPNRGWPYAPNWAWQHLANHMSQQDRPWLWSEADSVFLVATALDQIQTEYEKSKHLFMGPKVKGMGHFNGGMIYPPDAAIRMPMAMRCTDLAWDYVTRQEMAHDAHDASHLMQHVWSIMGEDAVEVGGGQVPSNVTLERANRWIRKGAVMIHRIKDTSLLTLLMHGIYKP